jgi:hypothetical protein
MAEKSSKIIGPQVDEIKKECMKTEVEDPAENCRETAKKKLDPKLYKCDVCAHTSSSGISLGIHKRNVHKKDNKQAKKVKTFACDVCDKAYPSQRTLIMHKKKFHSYIHKDKHGVTNKIHSSQNKVSDNEPNGIILDDDKQTKEMHETNQIQTILMAQLSGNEFDFSADEDADAVTVVGGIKKPSSRKISRTSMEEVKKYVKTEVISNEILNTDLTESKSVDATTKKMNQLRESKYFQSQPKLFSLCDQAKEKESFVEFDIIPGWRSKRTVIRKHNGDTPTMVFFLSPESILLRSGIGVLEYLRLDGASPGDLVTLAGSLRIREAKLINYIGRDVFDL